jgi:hypothetical protein
MPENNKFRGKRTRQLNLLSYGFLKPLKMDVHKMETKEMPKFDASPYVGTKTEIVKAELVRQKYGLALKVETAIIPLKDGDTLPNDKHLTASILLSFSIDDDGKMYIGKDSKMDKFCIAHKVDKSKIPDEIKAGDLVKAFEGIKVTCQLSDNGFLTIA